MSVPEHVKRSLVVEDDPLIACDLVMTLWEMGLQVCGTAATAGEALTLFAEHQPDVITMDLRLAEGSHGLEAAEAIRRRDDTPIVFVTDEGDREAVRRLYDIPRTGLAAKPYSRASLEIAIEAACSA